MKRSTVTGGPYSTVGTVSTLTFTDTGLTGGTVYYYVINGVNSGGEGTNSGQASGTAVATPSGVAAAAGTASVSLSWTATAGASSYTIRRGTASGGPYGTT